MVHLEIISFVRCGPGIRVELLINFQNDILKAVSISDLIDTASATNVKNLVHQTLFCSVVKKLGSFLVYSLSFSLADLNWPKAQLLCISASKPVLCMLFAG